MYRITDNGMNFFVEILGVAKYADLIEAIGDLLSRPNCYQQNNIWLFGREFFEIQFEELELITDFILQNFQKDGPRHQTALVVPPGFNMALVEVWATCADRLPFDVRIFSDMKSAEDWVAR